MKLFPEHWKTDSVSALCTDVVDCVNKTAPVVEGPTEYKMIRTTNVKAGRISLDDCRYVDEATFVKWTRRIQPKRNDIVLTREAPLGEVGLLRSDEAVFLGQRTMLYRANAKKLDQRFLYYSMLGPLVQGQIRSHGSGASIVEQADIDSAVKRIEALLDASVVVDNAGAFSAKEFEAQYKVVQRGKPWNLSTVNVDKLREEFKKAPFKNIEIADLQAFLQRKLAEMLAQNTTRGDFLQRLQNVIDAYNSGATSTENYYEELTAYANELKEEAERHIREGLSEDELELFDLLKKDALTQEETQRVKLAASHLLRRLAEEHPKVLVQNWHQSAQTQKQVRAEIERVLDEDLPETYDRTTFKQKCDNVYDLAIEYALRGRKWAA